MQAATKVRLQSPIQYRVLTSEDIQITHLTDQAIPFTVSITAN
jgi:hypothetical protein